MGISGKENIYKSSYSKDRKSTITCASKHWHDRVEGLLARYVLQASIHTIWKERNERKHGKGPNLASRLIKWIDRHIHNQNLRRSKIWQGSPTSVRI